MKFETAGVTTFDTLQGAGRPTTAHVLLVAGLCLVLAAPVQAGTKLPPVDDLLQDLQLAPEQLQRAKGGTIVELPVKEGSERELSVSFTLLAEAGPEDVARLYREARDLEMIKSIKLHGPITGEGSLADFEQVVLEPNPEKEARRYLDAEPGDTLNLDEKEIAAFRALKSSSEGKAVPVREVEQLIRQLLLARFQAYRAKGLAGIPPYQRENDLQLSVAGELLLAAEQSVGLRKYVPALHEVLTNYPAAKAGLEAGKPGKAKSGKRAKAGKAATPAPGPADTEERKPFEESFNWYDLDLLGRPTFVLEHRLSMFVDYAFVTVVRHFYASHDYNSLQQVVAAIPTKDGTVLLYVGRLSTDQLAGFAGVAVQPVARNILAPYIREMFEGVRSQVEDNRAKGR